MVEVGLQQSRWCGVQTDFGASGVAPRWIAGAFASVTFPYTIKSRRWQAMTEEVDKGCSKSYATAGTVTRTAGILIHGRLMALAATLSQPSNQLWLYVGLIGSNKPLWLKAP